MANETKTTPEKKVYMTSHIEKIVDVNGNIWYVPTNVAKEEAHGRSIFSLQDKSPRKLIVEEEEEDPTPTPTPTTTTTPTTEAPTPTSTTTTNNGEEGKD